MSIEDYHFKKGYPKEDFEDLPAEYAKYFIDYYNRDNFNAISSLKTYRDESIRRITELNEEIDYLINQIKNELKGLRLKDEKKSDCLDIFYDLEPHLDDLKRAPNGRLIYLYKEILEDKESMFNHDLGATVTRHNRTITRNIEGYLEEVYSKSHTLRKVTIIKSTASVFINTIIDNGAPLEFKGRQSYVLIRSLLPNKQAVKPGKDTIYEWYGDYKKESDSKSEAFQQLQTEIAAHGLEVEDYITTDDPENFDRSYRTWLKTSKIKGRK